MTTQYHLISPQSPLFLRKYIVEKFGLILFRMPKIQVFASVLDLSKQALFYFPKSSSYLGRNPSLHPGEGASLSRPLGQEDCRSPPLTLSPQDTLTYWEEDISAYRMHSSSPSNANINAEMEVIVFPSR